MLRHLKYLIRNEYILRKEKILKYSNLSNMPIDVGILTYLFFDKKGDRIINGGAERYLLELSRLIRNNFDFNVTIFQSSYSFATWEKTIDKNIKLIGLPVGNKSKNLNFIYHRFIRPRIFTIYNLLDLAQPFFYTNSISISHGIYWDNPNIKNKNRKIKEFSRGLKNSKFLVSVDTNTINFFRSIINIREINHKMFYVPNFVETELFRPALREKNNSNKIVITYPRRLYEARGFYIFIQAVEMLLKKYNNLVINFIGEVDNEEVNNDLMKFLSLYPKNVFHKVLTFDKMPDVYQESDIVVIPTIYSEGTSLSLLEAMACKCCVISTNVGGLTNIILDNYNGKLCNPDSNSIFKSIEEMINDREKRMSLCQNAYITATQAFNKRLWVERWLEIINMALGKDYE